MKNSKKLLFLICFTLLFSLSSNYLIKINANHKTYSETNLIPKNRVGLVLGTGKYNAKKEINACYKNRIEATLKLFNAQKINLVLVSGSNKQNELQSYKQDLINGGIPENNIYMDYSGFRTIDSVIRAKEIYGLEKFTIISQKFHNERAIYLAEKKGLQVVGFNAKDPKNKYTLKKLIKEYISKTVAPLDIFFNTEASYLGEKSKI